MGPAGPAASPRATAAAGVAVLLNSCTNLKQGISRGCGLSGYLVAPIFFYSVFVFLCAF